MAKAASDKLPVILLLTTMGTTKVLIRKTFGEDYYVLDVVRPDDVLEHLKTTKIDWIIFDDKVDTSLPKLCQSIREIDSLKKVPIFIISNNLKRSYMKELLASGATQLIYEPLEEETLRTQILSATKSESIQKKLTPLVNNLTNQPLPTGSKSLSNVKLSMHDHALQIIHKSLENKQSIGLLMVHIDTLQKIHDKWGELATEEILDEVESHLKTLLRIQDLLLRASQQRFALILPKTSQTASKLLAENVEESFKDTKFTTHKGSVRLHVSIGVVTLSHNDLGIMDAYNYLENLLKTGEEYLEKAKKIGQRIVFG